MSDKKPIQIALTGEMRSGKDFVGKYLVEEYGFKRFAFGDGIVKTCKKLFPEHFEGGVKPRKLLQEFGQFCVGIDKEVWIRFMFKEMLYQGIDPLEDNVVITDLRQPHEYDHLLASGFVIVKISAEAELRRQRIISIGETVNEEAFNHETEQHVSSFAPHYELDNNGTREELIEQIEDLMKGL